MILHIKKTLIREFYLKTRHGKRLFLETVFVYFYLFDVSLIRTGVTANIISDVIAAARNISGAGINSVVIVSAPPPGKGIPIPLLIALPIEGPASIGISTQNIIRTP